MKKKPSSEKRVKIIKKPNVVKRVDEAKNPMLTKRVLPINLTQAMGAYQMAKRKVVSLVKTEEDYQNLRNLLRLLVRTREDYQAMRKTMDNRLGKKADGEDQDRERLTARAFSKEDTAMLSDVSANSRAQEMVLEKQLGKVLARMPIYAWLKGVKGVGAVSAAHICAAFDIYKAETVSRMWQYAGMNPGMVVGKKRVETKDGEYDIVATDTMVRGDKLTPGFVSPFNTQLRVALCGVLAGSFIKAKAPYALNFYYPYKARLEQSDAMVTEQVKGGKLKQVAWKDAKPAHRDRAAQRYMIKMFIADLYAAWRPLHGLSVREPYQAEYLGHRHAAEA